MTPASNGQAAIVRTERGLTIAGTRITLYDVMDYVVAKYPPAFIRVLFDLTEAQIQAALSYIDAHRAEVETEYQQVLDYTEELRQYYEEQNRDRMARIATLPPPPGLEAAWEKLQASKARHQQLKEGYLHGAELIPTETGNQLRPFGLCSGEFSSVPADFDDPLPEELLSSFEQK